MHAMTYARTGLDTHLDMQAAERAAAKGKAVDPHATKATPALKESLPASPAKSQQGQWKTKPTAARLASGSGTSKEPTPKAVDALALMPRIPPAPSPATADGVAGPASASPAPPGADPAPASNHHNPAQGESAYVSQAVPLFCTLPHCNTDTNTPYYF